MYSKNEHLHTNMAETSYEALSTFSHIKQDTDNFILCAPINGAPDRMWPPESNQTWLGTC